MVRNGRERVRFTPTGVGTIGTASASATLTTVHPHGRGDNANGCGVCAIIRGSPPRAWGQWAEARLECRALRFTPTGVGTMNHPQRARMSHTVHPHGRGDNSAHFSSCDRRCGSPPRAWGQLHPIPRGDRSARFTPTGVGTI